MSTLAATGRADLTDAQWAALQPLLPVGRKPGRPPKSAKRQLLNGIRWRIRVGAPWRDIPPAYGPWQTVYGLFRRWQRNGIWKEILAGLQTRLTSPGVIIWDVSVDSTTSRAHQHAAGARQRGICRSNRQAGSRPNPLITDSAAHGEGSPRRLIWPPSKARNRCRCWLLRDSGATARSSRQYWRVFGWPESVVGGCAPAQIGCWPTRLTVHARTAPTCGGGGSRRPSRSRRTRLGTGRGARVRVVGHRRSIRRSTSSGTQWSAVSTGSNAIEVWPLATTVRMIWCRPGLGFDPRYDGPSVP